MSTVSHDYSYEYCHEYCHEKNYLESEIASMYLLSSTDLVMYGERDLHLPREIREDLIDRAIRDVLVDAVSGLTQGEGQLVTHSQQLAETYHLREEDVGEIFDSKY